MRIGIDGHVLGKRIGGVERYVEKMVELVPGLCPQHDFVVFVSPATAARLAGDARPNLRYVSLPVSDPIVQRSVLLPWAIRRQRLDALLVQRVVPWFPGSCRILLTVHDLIPLNDPRSYPGLRNALVRLLTPGSVARADLIVCPTLSVCTDIARRYPAVRAPLRAYYNGVDATRFAGHTAQADSEILRLLGVTGRYLFSPGAIEPRKDVETIIRALALLDPATRPLLLLSGPVRDPRYFARARALAAALGVAQHVRHLGFVSDEQLVALYGQSAACIAASRDEGFNMPPLEALACGASVLCSEIPAHRELFAGAARFFPPGQADRLAQAIRDCLAVGRDDNEMRAAQACVARLSWEAMAGRMAGFLDELLAGSGRRRAVAPIAA